MTAAEKNVKLQRVVLFIAILLFVVKTIAWFLTGSLAILTDALESIVNILAGGLGLYSLRLSARPRDSNHPYGHGKVEFISSALEGSLIVIAGIFIIYKSIESIFSVHKVASIDFGILLIGFTAIVNFALGRICINAGKKSNSLQLIAGGKHLVTDTLSTAGIVVGLVAIYFTGLDYIDSLIALVVSVFIIFTGYKIIRTSIAGIMDEADAAILKGIVDALNKNRPENWIDIHNMRIIKYGSRLHCDCHLTVPWYLNVREAHDEVEALAALIRSEFGTSVEFFVHSDGCMPFSCRICTKHNCMVRHHPFEQRVELTVGNIAQIGKHKLS